MSEENALAYIEPAKKEESLEEYLSHVRTEMAKAMDCGIRGHNLVSRVEGDIKRLLNSAFLNLADLVYDYEKQNSDDHVCETNRSMDGETCLICREPIT